MQVVISAKTNRAKNKIREAKQFVGDWDSITWDVLRTESKLPMSTQDGPWFLVAPNVADSKSRDSISRWVHGSNDADFSVNLIQQA